MQSKEIDGYYSYISGVLDGSIVTSIYIRQQVERLEAMKAREDIYFDEEAVDTCFNFISIIKHYSGKSAGKQFILEPWQKFVIGSVIGIKYKESGLRVCRELLCLISRKNGKTALIAALALYMLVADGEQNAQIGCLAASREQARLCFEMIQNFAKSIDPASEVIKNYRNIVKCPSNKGEIKVYSSDSSKLDGTSQSVAIIDEGHNQKDNLLYSVMKSSMGFRQEPLMVQITTAGFLLDGYPLFETYKMSIEILAGIKEQDDFFPFLYVMDTDDDWEDEENWIKCNPNMDVTVTKDYLKAQQIAAKNDATQEVPVKTKNFNIFCQSQNVWIQRERVVECMKKIDWDSYAGYQAYIGVDLSAVEDMTSLAVLIPIEGNQRFAFRTWAWLPEETFEKSPNKELYRKFQAEGSLILTPGNVVDYDAVVAKMNELRAKYQIVGVYYDPWAATQWAITCTEMGFPMQPFSQSIGHYSAAHKAMTKSILAKECDIEKSALYLWSVGNAVVKMDVNGNCLALDTEVPTVDGFKQIKDIEVGDYVFNMDGEPTKVIDTTDIHYDRDCYKLTFQNGAEVIADSGHRWWVNVTTCVRENGKKTTKTRMDYRDTEWLYKHYKNGQGNCCRYTLMNGAVQYPEKDYTIDPYVLGLWLGDGLHSQAGFAVNTSDYEIYDSYVTPIYGEPVIRDVRDGENCKIFSYTGKTLYRQLKSLDLIENKHIPEEYLYGSVEQRLSLIQGLMDTDGSCNIKNQQCTFSQKRKNIIEGIATLLDSLGIRHSKVTPFEIKGETYYNLCWYTEVPMFRLKRKLDRQMEYKASSLLEHNPILKVEKVESVPTKCITVEDERHLFLVTDKYLVTGNCKITKEHNLKKVDPVIASMTALGGMLEKNVPTDFDITIL